MESEFQSQIVRGKNEYLYGSVRAEMVVKVEASEKRVNVFLLLILQMRTSPIARSTCHSHQMTDDLLEAVFLSFSTKDQAGYL